MAFERARKSLLRLEDQAYHPKNWRPVVLALSGTGWTRPHLAVYGHWLTAGHGILSLAHIVHADIDDHAERQARYETTLRKFIRREELQAFPAVVIAEHLSSGIESLLQCHGIGGLRPNTVLMGWPHDVSRADVFGANLRLISRFGRSIVCARFREESVIDASEEDETWDVPAGTIDVWWRGMANGELLLLLAHLLHRNPEWRNNPVRILRIVSSASAVGEVRNHLVDLAASSRIEADPVVVIADNVAKAIQQASANSAITLLGFDPPGPGQETVFYEAMERIAGSLPRVLIVRSGGGMELAS